jgi:anti-anti-sigma factor
MDELGTGGAAPLRLEVAEDTDGAPLLRLAGEIDMTNARELDARVAPIIARSPDRLVVDVTQLEFADSSAIALLVKWASHVHQVELREPSELLRRVIARMGLADRLQVRP